MNDAWGVNEVTVCSDWDNSNGLNVNNVNKCLTAATDEMDRYIAVRYQLPLTVVPDDLIRICCDIAMYRLCPFVTTLTDQKKDRYKEAVGFLRDLSTGKATLGAAQNLQTAAAVTTIEVTCLDRALTRGHLRRLL
jgi:phage gp36-like protein